MAKVVLVVLAVVVVVVVVLSGVGIKIQGNDLDRPTTAPLDRQPMDTLTHSQGDGRDWDGSCGMEIEGLVWWLGSRDSSDPR